jgi:hypothetical protein
MGLQMKGQIGCKEMEKREKRRGEQESEKEHE